MENAATEMTPPATPPGTLPALPDTAAVTAQPPHPPHGTLAASIVELGAAAGISKPYLLPKESPMHIPPHVVLARIDDDVEHLKTQIRILRERNFIKDKGKKFEGSYTRICFIMVITYSTISIYMTLIGVKDPLLNAIVPTVGFNLSTWSLPWLKKLWMVFYDWNYGNGRSHMTFEEFEALERAEMGKGK